MSGEVRLFIVSWEALAFVFAILPGLVAIAYCYDCGHKKKKATFVGYWNLLKLTNRAKKQAYRKTAEALLPFPPAGAMVVGFAWLFALIVALVSPAAVITAVCLVLAVPSSAIAYYFGRRNHRPKNRSGST